ALARWLLVVHTSLLMAYPLGNANGAGAVTFPLFLVGAWACWRARRRGLLALCLAPFALNLVAAALHRYPSGGCCRLSQHLAPAVCLLTGVGVADVVRRLAPAAGARLRVAQGLCGALALLGVAGVGVAACRPYREDEDRWARDLVREVLA